MNEELLKRLDAFSSKLEAVLVTLAEGLGTTAEYVWELMVRQAVIEAVLYSFPFVALMILVITFFKRLFRISKVERKLEDGDIVPTVILGLTMIVFLIITVTTFSNVVYGFLNPEYVALQKVLDLIK